MVTDRRLLLVSNRLPLTIRVENGGVRVNPSTGGVATGLNGLHRRSNSLWIGWPGHREPLDEGHTRTMENVLTAERAVPVQLSPDEVRQFYDGFSNTVLWPLFHYQANRVPIVVTGWDEYVSVNQRFADITAAHARPGDLIWVHDYQLMLVPRMLRQRIPDARIGFFLHIPFPTSELFSMLPSREQIVDGMMGADLIGFHTLSYAYHFASSVQRLLGAAPVRDRFTYDGRSIRFGAFPMGIDAEAFSALAAEPAVEAGVRRLRGTLGEHILLAIDRLDYTKGVQRRLLAYEMMLRRHPELHGRVRLIQIAVPTRDGVDAYRTFRDQVDEMVSKINEAYGTAVWRPLDYVYRCVGQRELVVLFRAADVMLVTPIRDGMNLVAKEFVASRTDGDGVLVLSEFAGAASELAEAVIVNPFDAERTAESMFRALRMQESERRSRMRGLRSRVFANQLVHWADRFLSTLDEGNSARTNTPIEAIAGVRTSTPPAELAAPELR
jgi:trehalose 6-phosphate synthase/phosphatase